MSRKFAESLKTIDHYDACAPIRLWVGNLGLYNECYLVGEWISLPATEDEIADMYTRIGVSDGHNMDEFGTMYEETIFCDYECEIPGYRLHEYGDINEYNEVAEWWTDLDESERLAVAIRLDNGSDIDTLMSKPKYCLTDGMYIYECDNEADAAREQIEEFGGLSELNPEILAAFFDYEEYARYYCDFSEVKVNGTAYQVDFYE